MVIHCVTPGLLSQLWWGGPEGGAVSGSEQSWKHCSRLDQFQAVRGWEFSGSNWLVWLQRGEPSHPDWREPLQPPWTGIGFHSWVSNMHHKPKSGWSLNTFLIFTVFSIYTVKRPTEKNVVVMCNIYCISFNINHCCLMFNVFVDVMERLHVNQENLFFFAEAHFQMCWQALTSTHLWAT